MLIRHAEKPNGDIGIMADGSQNGEALTAEGWQRAEALVALFAPPGGRFADSHLATPAAIFASGVGRHSKSLRPEQTVTPLATRLRLPIETKYPKGSERALVQAVTMLGGVVLIAWEHEAIPEIATLIRGSDHDIPLQWPNNRFDDVWVFDRPIGNVTWSFTQVPQRLLPGDSADPIPLA
jgi:broad specificity phosphatase PhoE